MIAIVQEQLLVGAAHGLQRVLAVNWPAPGAIVLGRVPERVGDSLEAAFDRGDEQLALAGKEAEHVRLGDADPACDPIDRRSVQTRPRELVDSRRDQLLAPLGGWNPAPRRLGRGLLEGPRGQRGRSRAMCGRRGNARSPASLRSDGSGAALSPPTAGT